MALEREDPMRRHYLVGLLAGAVLALGLDAVPARAQDTEPAEQTDIAAAADRAALERLKLGGFVDLYYA
jgi:hypothetical protein